ncbi:uncharacterized protein LOC105433295 isoform X2 [Pogonomyrmex barbatus]|uniref:Uncharacterized protein LOC105433295 isoform X2 n=1 Tax=Pogonomyrmex barbatus TaxID=144034 RepID=A0A6I9WSC0_9HYME|nr:uncharacterized protein LOC105433295 isoform X2 [Pogonomyrmex barbatus]
MSIIDLNSKIRINNVAIDKKTRALFSSWIFVRLMYLMNECEKEISEAEREMASPQWDQFIQCLSKAGLVSARVIHFSVQIRIWTSNRLDHSYQFVLLHRPGVIPPLVLCNLSKKRRMLKTICFII